MASQRLPEEVPDLCALPWVYETGENVFPATAGQPEHRIPYRTIFALDPEWGDDRCPLADLTEEADDQVGRLMAAGQAFYAACGPQENVSALDWLGALLADLRADNYPDETEDPQSTWTALLECEGLLETLRHIVREVDGPDALMDGVRDLPVAAELAEACAPEVA
ncbi:MAG TPA: hypothetical protein VFU47_03890 [Armatimonadota bacterium]|nr:hypothetical protein [Armatimonadota bacterium]